MFRTFERARFAIAPLGLALAFIVPAVGEDFAGWSDYEVNAALVDARLQLAPQLNQANRSPCPAMGIADTAGAIDCEVNQALAARLQIASPRELPE